MRLYHTGKQPDWSTGPINTSSGTSTGLKAPEALSSNMHAAFQQSRGMDAVLPHSNLQKRGLQTAPGPPGLQRCAAHPELFPLFDLKQQGNPKTKNLQSAISGPEQSLKQTVLFSL